MKCMYKMCQYTCYIPFPNSKTSLFRCSPHHSWWPCHRVESFSESLLVVALVAFLHASVHKAPNIQDRLDPCHRPQGILSMSCRQFMKGFVGCRILGRWLVIFLFGGFFFWFAGDLLFWDSSLKPG